MQSTAESVKARIERKLREAFAPTHVEVVNESGQHNVPPGSESHFRVTLVADDFAERGLVARHRRVYRTLDEEMAGPVHALALHIYTPAEWVERHGIPESPPCLGGGG